MPLPENPGSRHCILCLFLLQCLQGHVLLGLVASMFVCLRTPEYTHGAHQRLLRRGRGRVFLLSWPRRGRLRSLQRSPRGEEACGRRRGGDVLDGPGAAGANHASTSGRSARSEHEVARRLGRRLHCRHAAYAACACSVLLLSGVPQVVKLIQDLRLTSQLLELFDVELLPLVSSPPEVIDLPHFLLKFHCLPHQWRQLRRQRLLSRPLRNRRLRGGRLCRHGRCAAIGHGSIATRRWRRRRWRQRRHWEPLAGLRLCQRRCDPLARQPRCRRGAILCRRLGGRCFGGCCFSRLLLRPRPHRAGATCAAPRASAATCSKAPHAGNPTGARRPGRGSRVGLHLNLILRFSPGPLPMEHGLELALNNRRQQFCDWPLLHASPCWCRCLARAPLLQRCLRVRHLRRRKRRLGISPTNWRSASGGCRRSMAVFLRGSLGGVPIFRRPSALAPREEGCSCLWESNNKVKQPMRNPLSGRPSSPTPCEFGSH